MLYAPQIQLGPGKRASVIANGCGHRVLKAGGQPTYPCIRKPKPVLIGDREIPDGM